MEAPMEVMAYLELPGWLWIGMGVGLLVLCIGVWLLMGVSTDVENMNQLLGDIHEVQQQDPFDFEDDDEDDIIDHETEFERHHRVDGYATLKDTLEENRERLARGIPQIPHEPT